MITAATPDPGGRRLGALLLGYLALVVALIVLAPFQFDPTRPARVGWASLADATGRDVVLNVVLFFPLGLLYERLGGGRRSPLRVLGLAAVLSSAIELIQLTIPGRYSSVIDIATNAAGAWMGAWASVAIRRRLGSGAELVGRFFLDLPLVALCWLLVPWLWLISLTGEPTGGGRLWLAVPLAAAAGTALAAAGRSGARPNDDRSRWPLLSPMALGWAAMGLMPLWGLNATIGAAAVLALAGSLVLGDAWWGRSGRTERRVEPGAALAVLLLMLPWFVVTSPTMGSLGWAGHGAVARVDTLSVVELLAGFSVLGYAIAEQGGRRSSGRGTTMTLAAALLIILCHGDVRPGRSVALLVAALTGSAIYRTQRQHIVSLLDRAGRQ